MMLKHPYQETLGYRIYDGYMKFTGGNFIAAFLLMTVAVSLIADPACAAPGQNQSVGMDMDGKLEPTDFTQASTKEFAQNLGLSFTAVRVIGTVIIAGGLVMTAIGTGPRTRPRGRRNFLSGAPLLCLSSIYFRRSYVLSQVPSTQACSNNPALRKPGAELIGPSGSGGPF